MIPPKSDPKWKRLVTGNEQYALTGLAARMMLTRARLMAAKRDERTLQEAIDVAYEYFSKNSEAARDDIRALFGEERDV
jgi:hypothetical protein